MSYRINYWSKQRRKGKYNNHSQMYNGVRYDSIKEAQYAEELDWRVKAGEIEKWERQIRIPLYINGKKWRTIIPDFKVYNNDGSIEIHEVKGYATNEWQMKWDMLHLLKDEIFPEGVELIVIQ